MKYFNGGVSIDFLLNAPKYFINTCIDVKNDEAIQKNKEIRKMAAQKVINKMRGK